MIYTKINAKDEKNWSFLSSITGGNAIFFQMSNGINAEYILINTQWSCESKLRSEINDDYSRELP